MTVTIGRRELLAALGGAAAWPGPASSAGDRLPQHLVPAVRRCVALGPLMGGPERIRAALWAIGRPENGGRLASREPNEVLIKVPIRLFERVGFHRTAKRGPQNLTRIGRCAKRKSQDYLNINCVSPDRPIVTVEYQPDVPFRLGRPNGGCDESFIVFHVCVAGTAGE